LQNQLNDDLKFVHEIDDPQATNPASKLLSVPLYLKESLDGEIGVYPNAVVTLINKDHNQNFDEVDS